MKATDAELSEVDRLIVVHIATGKTRQSTARALRISERTVRRRLDDLCRRYGVASLLGLGLLLGNAGAATLDLLQQASEL